MICVSIANISFNKLQNLLTDFEMIELRLDLLNFSDEEYIQILATDIPVIATYRYGKRDDDFRIQELKKLIEFGVEYIDIEIDASKYFVGRMISYAKSKNCKTILSYHNFEETPSIKNIEEIIEEANKLGADSIKIATMAQSENDVKSVLSLYAKNKNLIAFCMGEIGKKSRIESVKLGANIIYTALSKENQTAEGQFTYSEIKKQLEQ